MIFFAKVHLRKYKIKLFKGVQKMKKFKKLIPAFCMLMVSAVLLGTSTYAWFSMNNTVTATGMSVTATTNTKYLLIGNSSDLSNATTTCAPVKATGGVSGETKVYPSAKATGNITIGEVSLQEGDWYTANSKVHSDSASIEYTTTVENETINENITNVTIINDNKGNYHLVYKFYIGLADGTATSDLVFKNTVSGDSALKSATKALITIGTAERELNVTNQSEGVTFSNISLSTTGIEVIVTLYVDGNDASVVGNMATSITGSLNFEIVASGITADGTSGT